MTAFPAIRLPQGDFDELASGGGDAGSALRTGQLSKRMLLLHTVVETAARRAPDAARYPGNLDSGYLDTSLRVLANARRTNRSETDKILLQPRVGAWAEYCLRQLVGTTPSGAGIPEVAEIGALAATAAHAAGIDFDLPLPTTSATVVFPGFGVADVPLGSMALRARGRTGMSTIEVGDETESVVVPLRDPVDHPGWRPLRRLMPESAGLRLAIAVDDVDPFRDPHGLGATARLSASEVKLWEARLGEAWQLLTVHHRQTAAAIADGIDCLVPLQSTGRAPDLSATVADSFGAIALTLPRNPLAFASALVHEFQHTKLSALLDLVPLHSRTGAGLFYAPWRADARPLRGLFQGTYAYLGLAEFMNVQRQTGDPAHRRFAEFEFARFREQVWRASDNIAASGSLTTAGEAFLAAMRGRIQQLRQARVEPSLRATAARAGEDHETTWRLANLRCDEEQIDQLVRAFNAGDGCPVAPATVRRTIVRTPTTFRPNPRLKLAYLRLTDAAAFHALVAEPTQPRPPELSEVTPADVQLAAGDFAGAAQRYREELTAHPERLELWAGLSATRRSRGSQPDDPLVVAPELVLRVHRELRQLTGRHIDPVKLSAWLARGD